MLDTPDLLETDRFDSQTTAAYSFAMVMPADALLTAVRARIGDDILRVPDVALDLSRTKDRVLQLIAGKKTLLRPLPAILICLNGRGAHLIPRGMYEAWRAEEWEG
jgi:hypothetical protein